MRIIIESSFGHFQRPGNPGEPSTYPVITPTAAAGIIDNVYWHPGHTTKINSIGVLNPIEYASETLKQRNHSNGKTWLRTFELVANPRYVIDFWLHCDQGVDSKKRYGMLRDRLLEGAHFIQPYMGISDYPVTIELLDKDAPDPKCLDINFPLGRMPHYARFEPAQRAYKAGEKPFLRRTNKLIEDRPLDAVVADYVFFTATLKHGVIEVDEYPNIGVNGYAA
jgi:CRISPR-associated protein Cas5d